MSLATLGLGDSVVPFAALAAIMVAFQLALLYLFLPRRSEPARPRLSRAILIAYLLPATALMWAVLPAAVLRPSYASWWAAIQAMMVPMPAPFFWMMSQLARAEERPIDRRGFLWPALLAAAAIANETLMGYAFAALAGAPSLDRPAIAFALSINSPWFAASMIATMAGLLWWIPGPSWHRGALAGLAATSLSGPLWLWDPATAAAVTGAIMAATLFVLVYGASRPSPDGGPAPRGFIFAVAGAVAAMTAGGVVSSALPDSAEGFPLAVTAFVVMFLEVGYLLRQGLSALPDPTPPFRWSSEVASTA